MSHPQVYLPGVKSLDSANALKSAGLEDWHGREEIQPIPNGPDGLGGLLCSWRPGDPRQKIGFFPDEQTWLKSEGNDPPYWIGFWNHSLPTPEQLAKNAANGYYVKLADRQQWAIPAAGLLPRNVTLTVNGTLGATTAVKPEFAQFLRDAEDWADRFLAVDDDDIPPFDPAMAVFAYHALRINYRVTPEIVNHLGLFDYESVFAVARAVIDIQLLAEIQQQKKTADSASTPAG